MLHFIKYGKYTHKFFLIIIISSILIVFNINNNNIVNAQEDTETIEDFDDYGSGVTGAYNIYVIWEVDGTAELPCTTAGIKYSEPNSIRMKFQADSDFWLNMTSPIEFTGFSFMMYVDDDGTQQDAYIRIYNNTGVNLMTWHIQNTPSTYIRVYDFDTAGYKTMYASLAKDTWYKIGFQNNQTLTNPINYVYSYVLDTSDTLLGCQEVQAQTTTSFTDQLLDRLWIHNQANTAVNYYYYDDFNITNEDFSGIRFNLDDVDRACSGGQGSYLMVSDRTRYIEYEFQNEFTGIIRGISLYISNQQWGWTGSVTHYTARLGTKPLGYPTDVRQTATGYSLRWYNFNKTYNYEKVFLRFECNYFINIQNGYYWYGLGITEQSDRGLSRKHNDTVMYANNILDGEVLEAGDVACCYYFEKNYTTYSTPDLPDDELTDLKDQFGDPNYNYTFIIFDGYNIQCYYGIGSNPVILFYITDEYLNNTNYYLFQIIQLSTGKTVYTGVLDIYTNNRSGRLIVYDYEFTQRDSYYIRLINTSNYGASVDTILYISSMIHVCRNSIYNQNVIDVIEDYSIYVSLGVFIGLLGLSFIIGLKLNPTAFPITLMAGIMMFSIPDQIFTVFPTLFLFISGLILIIILLLIYQRG